MVQCVVTHSRQNKDYSLTTYKENFSQYVYYLKVPKLDLDGGKKNSSEHLLQKNTLSCGDLIKQVQKITGEKLFVWK